jgi:hypothetical protein
MHESNYLSVPRIDNLAWTALTETRYESASAERTTRAPAGTCSNATGLNRRQRSLILIRRDGRPQR